MAFEIVKMETRVASMIGWFSGICKRVTDFLPGGVTRTKFEALAIEMEEQDYSVYTAIKKAIRIAVYTAFNFPLLPATKAYGMVTFSASPAPSSDILIPAGTQVSTVSDTAPGITYATVNDTVLSAGQASVQASVLCATAGAQGNTGSGTITKIQSSINGITGVTNPSAFQSGADAETEAARAARFAKFIDSLSRGTKSAIEYGALQAALTLADGTITERVTLAKVVEPESPNGTISCYVFNGAGGTSNALVALAQQIIDGYEGSNSEIVEGYSVAGIECVAAAFSETLLNVTCQITSVDGYDHATLQASAVSVITSYIRSLGNDTFIYNVLVERLMALVGVKDVSISAPSGNQSPAFNAVFIPGTITVTVV